MIIPSRPKDWRLRIIYDDVKPIADYLDALMLLDDAKCSMRWYTKPSSNDLSDMWCHVKQNTETSIRIVLEPYRIELDAIYDNRILVQVQNILDRIAQYDNLKKGQNERHNNQTWKRRIYVIT